MTCTCTSMGWSMALTDPVSQVSPGFSAKARRGFGLVLVRLMVGFLQVRHALGAGMREFPLLPHEHCSTALGPSTPLLTSAPSRKMKTGMGIAIGCTRGFRQPDGH